jgi:hypothetical protein
MTFTRTSVIPLVIDALVAACSASPALSGVREEDGLGVSEEATDALFIGAEDPDSTAYDSAAQSSQEWASIGHLSRDERGSITCAAMSWSPDADPKAARDGVFSMLATVEGVLRADPSLGLVDSGAVALLICEMGADLRHNAYNGGESGAVAVVTFTVDFQARI